MISFFFTAVDRGANKAKLTEALAQMETLQQEVRAKSLEEAKQAPEVEAVSGMVTRLQRKGGGGVDEGGVDGGGVGSVRGLLHGTHAGTSL